MDHNPINSIVYVTRDIERALGITPGPSYQIITNDTPYSRSVKENYPDFVHIIANKEGLLGTAELLENEEVKKIIKEGKYSILVFKNNKHIQDIIKRNNWHFLNPPAELGEKIENKISQIEWLGDDGKEYLPKTVISKSKDILWQDKPIILQWEHGHTGLGTLLINSEKELTDVQTKFSERTARVSEYIKGPSFTMNIVIGKDTITLGNISYQITGLIPFTDNRFSTVGNDWSLPHSLLRDDELTYIEELAFTIGRKMKDGGWMGLFGIDLIKNEEADKINLIEINARQPASSTFESHLQEENRKMGVSGSTMFELHLAALQDKNISTPSILINDGAQIIQRLTKDQNKDISKEVIQGLEEQGYKTISYTNTNINEDLLRIQSGRGIMESDNKLNKRGQAIVNTLCIQKP